MLRGWWCKFCGGKNVNGATSGSDFPTQERITFSPFQRGLNCPLRDLTLLGDFGD